MVKRSSKRGYASGGGGAMNETGAGASGDWW